MRIEELSIGDWVCAKLAKWESDDADMTPPLQVKAIYGIERHNLYVDLFNSTTNTIEHSAFVEDLIPIPLTPEILEKNGFEFQRESLAFVDYVTKFENRKILLLGIIGGEMYCLMYEDEGKREMHQIDCLLGSVHQLQHALRLAGIGKEIEV